MKQSGQGTGTRRAPACGGPPAWLVLAALAALAGVPAAPQPPGAEAAGTRDCIDLMRIARTRVADEDTILFYLRGGEIYRNDLPSRCPNLDRDERFMYRVSLNRLCSLDTVTVLEDVGFGFLPGASCGLGKFRAIDKEEADGLLGQRRRRGRD
jgi:hypothetical protein